MPLFCPLESAREALLPHKFVTPDVLERLKNEIAQNDLSIARIRAIGSGGSNALSILKEMVKDLMDTAIEKKNNALDASMNDGKMEAARLDRAAHLCRGQEIAFENIYSLLNNPQEGISFYTSQKTNLEAQLASYKSYDQRPSTEG